MNKMNILPLESPAATLELTGGKGASLSRLANAGLPVPGGFHITTLAYRRFVAENGLMPHIFAALQVVQPARPETLEEASRSIREMFLKAHIPDELAAEITQAYHALAGEQAAVAVRSSATAEDLPDASFAGQQETYLNVSGAAQVLEAVRKCWASLWTGRAIGYRARQGIHAESVALAVVVQLLVPAEAAGILFTANPLNGRRDQLLVNAAWGLGEAVVGGLVTPDTLVVEKDGLNLIESQVVDKQVMTVRTDNGTEEQEVPLALRKAPVLDAGAAVELCRMALRIEELYGMPMDIEWARMRGAFSILQARPITVLPEPEAPLPQEWKLPNRRAKYMRNNIVELIPDPMPPLFETFGRRAINAALRRVVGSVPGMEDIERPGRNHPLHPTTSSAMGSPFAR